MKRIFTILALASLVALSSCDFVGRETVVTLDDGVDARVTKVMKEYQETMTSAPYGWIFDVLSDEGYYQFHMVFGKDNKVTMYTDNDHYYEEFYNEPKTSTWNMRSLQRPVLSFDTYSYLAIINDPDNNISYGSKNMGLGADFEFEVDEVKDGVFYFTGRVNRVPAFMRPATQEEYNSVKEGGLMDVIVDPQYYNPGKFNYFEVNGIKVSILFNGRSIDMSYSKDNAVTQVSSLVIPDLAYNMSVMDTVVIEGKTLTDITFDPVKQVFNAVLDGTPSEVKCQDHPIIPLHFMLGAGLSYEVVDNIIDMYPDIASNDVAFQEYMAIYSLSMYGYPMREAVFSFTKTETGEDRLIFEGVFGSYSGWATFYITFNEDRDMFTVNKMTFEDDLYGNLQGAFYGWGASYFLDYFIGKTFKIEWSDAKFGSYSMGQFTDMSVEGGSSFFCGALF